MKKVPVFLINGFLDSGKTSFVLSTIARDEFYVRGSTLIISCEEGEVEYNEEDLKLYNCYLHVFDSQEDMTVEALEKIAKMYRPNRIVFESNLMWDTNAIEFPSFFELSQVITIIDGSTFPTYYANMRQKFIDIISMSDIVAFTKLNGDRSSLKPYQTGLKVASTSAYFCLIDEKGILDSEAFDIVLPYDKTKDEIVIEDNDFGLFYIDTFNNRKDYNNKIVTYNAWVVYNDTLPENQFIAGRKVLNCCADDVQLYGFLVKDMKGLKLANKSWVRLRGRMYEAFDEEFQENQLVIDPLDIEIIDCIENEILDLR